MVKFAVHAERQTARELRQAIRTRPGMYTGSTGRGGQIHLLYEVLGNAIDLVLAGRAASIDVSIDDDGSFSVCDDGPGLDLSDPIVRGWFTEWHMTPTVDDHHPHIHLAWPGRGLAIVSSLSSKIDVESTHGEVTRRMTWSDGGATASPVSEEPTREPTGTRIRVWPDTDVLGAPAIEGRHLAARFGELDALIPTLRLTLDGLALSERRHPQTWQGGIDHLLGALNTPAPAKGSYRDPCIFRGEVVEAGQTIPIELAIGIAHRQRHQERMALWCNYMPITEDSSGFHDAIRTAVWRACAYRTDTAGPKEPHTEPLSGVSIVASLTMLDPVFGGPTRGRVDDPRATEAVAAILDEHLVTVGDEVLSRLMHHCRVLARRSAAPDQ